VVLLAKAGNFTITYTLNKSMKKKITIKRMLIGLILLLVIFQLFRIDKTNPATDIKQDFLSITNAAAEVRTVLKSSCYDCHSNEVIYPWYTNIAPVSWWIKHHINEGTRHLNFSIWGTYKSRKADKKLKECIENIEADEMPMSSYTLIHSGAKLSSEGKTTLISWFNSLRTYESDKAKDKQE
jgi:hypothetical protein